MVDFAWIIVTQKLRYREDSTMISTLNVD